MSINKMAQATVEIRDIENIILQKYLLKSLPTEYYFTFEYFKNLTGYKLLNFRQFSDSDLFTISNKRIVITQNQELLKKEAQTYCMRLIKKHVRPAQYKNQYYIYRFGYITGVNYYTDEETKLIDLLYNRFIEIFDYKISNVNKLDLLNISALNNSNFYHLSIDIYNAIFQKQIHIGDSILPYVEKFSEKEKFITWFYKSRDYDLYFNEKLLLKCDLETNINSLIKNFIISIAYQFCNQENYLLFLSKMSSHYSILIKSKDNSNEL